MDWLASALNLPDQFHFSKSGHGGGVIQVYNGLWPWGGGAIQVQCFGHGGGVIKVQNSGHNGGAIQVQSSSPLASQAIVAEFPRYKEVPLNQVWPWWWSHPSKK